MIKKEIQYITYYCANCDKKFKRPSNYFHRDRKQNKNDFCCSPTCSVQYRKKNKIGHFAYQDIHIPKKHIYNNN